MAAHITAYSRLGVFIAQTSDPDFLAEINENGDRYLILYYTRSSKAYACRIGGDDSRQVEFSGPYSITKGEARTLQDLRNRSEAR